ncbi:MAG: ABC transporter permease subunit [Armatimonadota bacterium]|nr:ABC transporter permease subunit [Armatimonadota bacterium]
MVLLLLLVGLVVYPLAVAILRATTDPTLRPDPRSLWTPATRAVLVNTAGLVGASSLIAVVSGTLLAWVQERTDGHLGLWGDLLPLVPLLLSPLVGAVGMVLLFHPFVGFVNVALRSAFRSVGLPMPDAGPLNIYTSSGLVLVTSLYLSPYAYLVLSAALRRVDPALEEASRVTGAGLWRTLRRVTLPAVLPAIGTALLLCAIVGLGLFSIPVVIGLPARIQVLSVYIFQLLEYYPPRTGDALALSGLLLALVQLLLILQRILIAPQRHASLSGAFAARRHPLGPWRRPVRLFTVGYLLAAVLAPLGALFLVSLQPYWTPYLRGATVGLRHYLELVGSGVPARAMLNSLLLGIATATLSILWVAGLRLHREARAPGSPWTTLDLFTAFPATFPHLVLAVALLVAFGRPPLDLRGSAVLLLLAYLILSLPFSARAAASACAATGRQLVEASQVFGAAPQQTLHRVLFPIARPFLISGWVVVFVQSAGEVTASSVLAGSRTPVVGRLILDLQAYGSYPQLAATAIALTCVNALAVAVALRLGRSGLDALSTR